MCIWKHWIFSNATILVVCVVNNRERLLYFVSHSLSWNFPSFFSIAFSPPTPLSLSFSHKNNIFNVCFDKSTPRFSDTNLLVPKICFFFRFHSAKVWNICLWKWFSFSIMKARKIYIDDFESLLHVMWTAWVCGCELLCKNLMTKSTYICIGKYNPAGRQVVIKLVVFRPPTELSQSHHNLTVSQWKHFISNECVFFC